jgi:hypothetical protein
MSWKQIAAVGVVVFMFAGISLGQAPEIGGRIVFTSDRDGTPNLFIYDLCQKMTTKLTNFPDETGITLLSSPKWSEDGTKILFAGWKAEGYWNFYLINQDGSNLRQITTYGGGGYLCCWDSYNPDIVYCSQGGDGRIIHKINISTTEDDQIYTVDEANGIDLSPAGEIILSHGRFWTAPLGPYLAYYDSMGNLIQRLYRPINEGGYGSVSVNRRDGRILTDVQFENRGWTNNILMLDKDGDFWSNVTNEAWPSPIKNYAACWIMEPNDEYITFTTSWYGNDEIVLMKADGQSYPQGMINLTNHPARDYNGDYTPTSDDDTPPTIFSLTALPNEIWPPNHRMVPISISVVASDNCSTQLRNEIIKVCKRQGLFPPFR